MRFLLSLASLPPKLGSVHLARLCCASLVGPQLCSIQQGTCPLCSPRCAESPHCWGTCRAVKGSSPICIHSLLCCRDRPGNWVTGDLKNQGMQSHCFLAKSSVPSEANSKPFNDSPVTVRCSDPCWACQNAGHQPPAPTHVSDSKSQGGPQCLLSSLYTAALRSIQLLPAGSS